MGITGVSDISGFERKRDTELGNQVREVEQKERYDS